MKAAVFRGPGNMRIEEVPDLACGAGDLVAKVLVCGICGSDLDRGEIIKAFVVLTAGGKLTDKEVIAFCRERLASYKLPKLVDFKTSLPRTSTGKIARKLLKESGQ